MAEPNLSIVIATKNRHTKLVRLLTSLNQPFTSFTSIEIVIVEDGPPYIRHENVPSFQHRIDLKFAHPSKRGGMASARNNGIRQTMHPLIAFLDDDCVCPKGWIDSVGNFFSHFTAAQVAGGITLPIDNGANLFSSLRHNIYYYEVFGQKFFEPTPQAAARTLNPVTIPYASGGNSAYRRTIFDKYGFFNESLPAYIDIEMGLRLHERDKPLLNQSMVAYHAHPSTLRAYLRRSFTSGQAKSLISRLHGHIHSPRTKVGLAFREILLNITRRNFSRARRLKPQHRLPGYFTLTLSELAHLAGIVWGYF